MLLRDANLPTQANLANRPERHEKPQNVLQRDRLLTQAEVPVEATRPVEGYETENRSVASRRAINRPTQSLSFMLFCHLLLHPFC